LESHKLYSLIIHTYNIKIKLQPKKYSNDFLILGGESFLTFQLKLDSDVPNVSSKTYIRFYSILVAYVTLQKESKK